MLLTLVVDMLRGVQSEGDRDLWRVTVVYALSCPGPRSDLGLQPVINTVPVGTVGTALVGQGLEGSRRLQNTERGQ